MATIKSGVNQQKSRLQQMHVGNAAGTFAAYISNWGVLQANISVYPVEEIGHKGCSTLTLYLEVLYDVFADNLSSRYGSPYCDIILSIIGNLKLLLKILVNKSAQ